MLPPTPIDLSIVPPSALTLIEEKVAPLVVQALSLLNGGNDPLKEVSMKVENITLPDEIFVVEATVPLKRVSIKTVDVDPSKGMIGTTSPSITDPSARMIGTMNPLAEIEVEAVNPAS